MQATRFAATIATIFLLAGCAQGSFVQQPAADYVLTDLAAVLPLGAESSMANDISHAGVVVGSAVVGGLQHAFFWEQDSTGQWIATDLGALLDGSSNAIGVNDSGEVVGTHAYAMPAPFTRAVIWRRQNGIWGVDEIRDPPLFRPEAIGDRAEDINNQEEIAWSIRNIHSGFRSARRLSWNSDRSGRLGSSSLSAHGINDRGDVVGGSIGPNASQRAFIYEGDADPAGALTQLGTAGGENSEALAVNNFRDVAGWAEDAAANQHAVIWYEDELPGLGLQIVDLHQIIDLTYPHLTYDTSEARAISDLGHAVGSLTNSQSEQSKAFLWSEFRFDFLDDLMPQGSEWQLTEAHGINNGGQIVGVGQYGAQSGGATSTQQRAYVMTPRRICAIASLTFKPAAINNRGDVVSEDINEPSYVWRNGQTIELGSAGGSSKPSDINDRGTIVGRLIANTGVDVPAYWKPFAATGPSADPLPVTAPPNIERGATSGISNSGTIVGAFENPQEYEGFVWNGRELGVPITRTITRTDVPCDGLHNGITLDKVNAAGYIVGHCVTTIPGDEDVINHSATRWSKGVVHEIRTTLAPSGGISQATNINNRGQIVGFTRTSTTPRVGRAFLWDMPMDLAMPGDTIMLGTLDASPVGMGQSQAFGINSRSQVVGKSPAPGGEDHAFLWEDEDRNGQYDQGEMVDLNDLLQSPDCPSSPTWELTSAVDINDSGQITGEGAMAGDPSIKGFVMTLPN